MQALIVCEALDGRDGASFHFSDQGEAGVARLAVDEDHAGPAFAVAAALLRARQSQPFA